MSEFDDGWDYITVCIYWSVCVCGRIVFYNHELFNVVTEGMIRDEGYTRNAILGFGHAWMLRVATTDICKVVW